MKNIFLLILLSLLKTNTLNAQILDATLLELNFLESSYPHNITKGTDKLFFSANDGIHGRELWVFNINSSSAYLVKDIIIGTQGSIENSIFLVNNNILYFTANDGTSGNELWRSDGTSSGTYIIKDINGLGDSNIGQLTSFNDKIVFSANNSINGQEIWISDGTISGTTLIKDIYPGTNGSNPSDFFIFNNSIYFVANDGVSGYELWISNGTNSGTSLLKDINISFDGVQSGNKFIVFGNNFYFYANNGISGFELWKSDGTNAGTQLLKDIYIGSNSSAYTIEGSSTVNYFVFSATTSIGKEIWKSDGTENGTQLLKDINPINNGIPYFNSQYVTYNGKIYFIANDNINGEELWVTDGTLLGTTLVKDIYLGDQDSSIQKLTSANGFLIFSAMSNSNNFNTLWKSDGTNNGTLEIKNLKLNLDSNSQLQFIQHNNEVYFQAGTDTLNGNELWKTNGTFINTNLVIDLNKKFSSSTDSNNGNRFFTEFNGKSVFISNNGFSSYEPFISDGTINGTSIIKDINPSNYPSVYTSYYYDPALTKVGNYIYFRATNGTNGYELFKTDGTAANTSMVKDIFAGTANCFNTLNDYNNMINFNNILYFKANNGVNGDELWRSDGTDAGTYMLKDINPGSGGSIRRISNHNAKNNEYAIANNLLYFSAYDGVTNSIWRTDGTTNGTIKVITIPSTGINDSGPTILKTMNNKIYFSTNINNSSYGNRGLWSSDGTQSSSVLLGTCIAEITLLFSKNEVFNNELYFNYFTSNGITLMKTNGTVSGTVPVKENLTYPIKYLNTCGNFLYFALGEYDTFDYELWRTDGSSNGTLKLADNSNNNFLFGLTDYTCINNNLIYLQEIYNNKIWLTDGFVSNTYTLNVNIINGDNFGTYEGIRKIGNYVNGKLFFLGSTNRSGTELYVTDFLNILDTQGFSGDKDKSNIQIYPNPTNSIINILTNNFYLINEIELYDFSGKLISKGKYNSNQIELNTSNLSSGIYFVKVKTDQSIETKKIIKQ